MYWDTAQQMAEATSDLDKINDQNVRSLQCIDIMCASLLAADVLISVYRHILLPVPTQGSRTRQLKRRKQYHLVTNGTRLRLFLNGANDVTEIYISSSGTLQETRVG